MILVNRLSSAGLMFEAAADLLILWTQPQKHICNTGILVHQSDICSITTLVFEVPANETCRKLDKSTLPTYQWYMCTTALYHHGRLEQYGLPVVYFLVEAMQGGQFFAGIYCHVVLDSVEGSQNQIKYTYGVFQLAR